jgi:acyl carrier protein
MNRDEIERTFVATLKTDAPEADPSTLDRTADLREELDIDSMDFLKLMTKVHQAFGIEIPEADYPELFTLDGAVAYVAGKLG